MANPAAPLRLLISLALPLALACAALGGLGGWLAARATLAPAIREYILSHPEVLPQAMENLRQRENTAALASLRAEVQHPWPGAVLGNSKGTRILVEFSDYACSFCRRSNADIDTLIAADPSLKIVMREIPILTPASADAARMALAAAAQGRYPAFHKAMFAAGKPDPASITAAAQTAGLDLARARTAIADPRITQEIDRNLDLARQLGFAGTPGWVAGGRLISGAVGAEALGRALAGIDR